MWVETTKGGGLLPFVRLGKLYERAAIVAAIIGWFCSVIFKLESFQTYSFALYAATLTAIISAETVVKNGLPWVNHSFFLYPTYAFSCIMVGAAIKPLVYHWHPDVPEPAWFFPCIAAVHLMTPLATINLFKMMIPYLPKEKFTTGYIMLWMSSAAIAIASIAEVVAHFEDGWVFLPGSKAFGGVHNMIFTIFMVAAFVFLPCAFNPTPKHIILSFVPSAVIVALFASPLDWKKVGYFWRLVSTCITAHCFQKKFDGSYWPWMFVAVAFSIIRDAHRIKEYENQYLHFNPGMYAFLSYTAPFMLTMNKSTRNSPWWQVFLAWLVFTLGSDLLERYQLGQLPLS